MHSPINFYELLIMRVLLLAIIFFCLPHANWIPSKLSLDEIPLGVLNWVFILSLLLWLTGRFSAGKVPNNLKWYNIFVLITIFSIVLSITYQIDDLTITLSTFKNQTLLLLMFYLPLVSIRDEKDFEKFFFVILVVNTLISVEVLRSGVLAGVNFNDSKRGSGPFALDLKGSDVAGAYLAQALMFFVALVLAMPLKPIKRIAAYVCFVLVVVGIYSTYARGALVGCLFGIVTMISFFGFKRRYVVGMMFMICIAFFFMPKSIHTRVDESITQNGKFDASTIGRFFYYKNALDIILQNPLGVGIGQVRGAMENKIGIYVDPHNAFLYTACEYGVVGLVIFIGLILNVYQQAKRVWLNKEYPVVYRAYALGMGGMVGSFIACNMFYANFYKQLVMGTIAIYLGMMAFILSGKNPTNQTDT